MNPVLKINTLLWANGRIRDNTGFLELGGPILEGVWGPAVPQWEKCCILYTFGKYFVCDAWCQSEHIDYCCSTQICLQSVRLQILCEFTNQV